MQQDVPISIPFHAASALASASSSAAGFWTALLIALCCIAALYASVAAAAMAVFAWRARRTAAGAHRLPRASPVPGPMPARCRRAAVSILKPLCGDEPRLYENLATFCDQRYPRFQLLFGVSSANDPAIAVVRRLQAAYPSRDIELVIDGRVHGSNLKVSNLINLAQRARHEWIVLADSDIAVTPDYLDTVTAPLVDGAVGVVTCLYRARPLADSRGRSFWPRLGAMFIDGWFVPSVRVANAFGSRAFGFGATLALRHATLKRIGGFAALKDCLADDYGLAERVRALGLRTVLIRQMVETDVVEPTLAALWMREIRWLRTIRSVNPAGFASLFITFTSPWMLAAALAGGARLLPFFQSPGAAHGGMQTVFVLSALTGLVARIVVHATSATDARARWRDLPLVPLRDVLLAFEWLRAAFGSTVVWRGVTMAVASGEHAREHAQELANEFAHELAHEFARTRAPYGHPVTTAVDADTAQASALEISDGR